MAINYKYTLKIMPNLRSCFCLWSATQPKICPNHVIYQTKVTGRLQGEIVSSSMVIFLPIFNCMSIKGNSKVSSCLITKATSYII